MEKNQQETACRAAAADASLEAARASTVETDPKDAFGRQLGDAFAGNLETVNLETVDRFAGILSPMQATQHDNVSSNCRSSHN